MLPYASPTLRALALDAYDNASFKSNATDQFLTMLALDSMAEYDGESDFGTLTRLDLDDELRVVLVLLDLMVRDAEHGDYEGRTREWELHCLTSHYRAGDAVLGEGGDQKWWAEWFVVTAEAADKSVAEFAQAYSAWLGDDE